jgi:hypothetical protein
MGTSCGNGDWESVLAKTRDVQLDRLLDETFDFPSRPSNNPHPGKIGHIGSKRGGSPLDDNKVLHGLILTLLVSGCS